MRKLSALLISLLTLWSAAAHADILIGVAGPVTGQDATLGEQMQRGAEAAAEAINATGGVLGQKIRLVIKDDACDPRQAVAVANQLAGEKVVAVVGGMCSGAAIPAAKVYNEENIPFISPSATNPLLTEQGYDNVLRVCGRDDQQGSVIADYLVKNYAKTGNIAIVHDRGAYGKGLADEVQKDIHAKGVKEKLYESLARGERDYGSLVSRLKQENIDILFFGGYHTEAGLITRQMRAQGLKTLLIVGEGVATPEYWSITGELGTGTLMSFEKDPRGRPESAEVVKQIRAKGFEPEGYTLHTYAAVQLIVEAIKKNNSTDPTKMMAELHKTPTPTVLGDLDFDKRGDITAPDYILYRWAKGTYLPLEGQ